MQVTGAEDKGPPARRNGPGRGRGSSLSSSRLGSPGRLLDIVGEDELAVAVVVEAPLGIEDRIDLRGAGDVQPLIVVGSISVRRSARHRHPVDLPGDLDLPPAEALRLWIM